VGLHQLAGFCATHDGLGVGLPLAAGCQGTACFVPTLFGLAGTL
jgi:hypothetical protein